MGRAAGGPMLTAAGPTHQGRRCFAESTRKRQCLSHDAGTPRPTWPNEPGDESALPYHPAPSEGSVTTLCGFSAALREFALIKRL